MDAKLILIRHGQSQWNLENRFTGWKDVDLTDTGEIEAHRAAREIKDERIDIAFTSALVRAQHTLDIIRKDCGWDALPVIIDPALNERAYGSLEGLNKAETARKFGEEQVLQWRRSYDIAPPGGESLEDTYHRVVPYFRALILPELLKEKNVLVVAHGNSLRALIKYLEKLTPAEILMRELATGVPVTYDFDSLRLRELAWETGEFPSEE